MRNFMILQIIHHLHHPNQRSRTVLRNQIIMKLQSLQRQEILKMVQLYFLLEMMSSGIGQMKTMMRTRRNSHLSESLLTLDLIKLKLQKESMIKHGETVTKMFICSIIML